MPPEKIDAVYTWCDASDPIFAKQRRDLMILKGIPEVEELNGMVRFENHDELRYSLRSVFENLPWECQDFCVWGGYSRGSPTRLPFVFCDAVCQT